MMDWRHLGVMTTTFITGATGTIGNQLARLLLERGDHTVRVGTRRPEAAAALAALGAEVAALDLDDPSTLPAAFAGVDRLFLVGPQTTSEFGATVQPILAAAKAAGVRFVLRLSALGASTDGGFALAREHGIGEAHVAASGIDWAILRPTFFQDNLLNFQGAAVAKDGAFYGASGGGAVSYISSADVARTAASILADPAPHVGKRYVLTGPEAMTDEALAALATDVIGKPLRYVDVTPDQLRGSMVEAGMPAWIADSLVALESVKAQGYAAEVSPAVEDITGKPPETYRAFLARNRARLV